ncbi:MAG: CoA ester lyase [Desulfobacteraceae bacterium]|nr:MAG: CoA ester lyase [Desulfobacteraceae bacterium]
MKPLGLSRSALFVPGNRPDRVDKAMATSADLVIMDMEDAVPVAEKAAVRPTVREKIALHRGRGIMVRVNALDTGLTGPDLEGVVAPGLDAILLPKVQTPEDIERMGRLMSQAELGAGLQTGTLGLMALIETALGVGNVFAIAAARTSPLRLRTLAFGAADFSLDMGFRLTKTGEELAFPRARIAVACRAGGIDPPLDTPYMIDLKDREAFEADARRGQRLGFGGKLCIHPNQVDFCNTLFSPTAEEIAFAEKVVAAFERAEADGRAAIQLDGKFIDYPVFVQSRRLLGIAEKMVRPRPG